MFLRRIVDLWNRLRRRLECGAIACDVDYEFKCKIKYLSRAAECLLEVSKAEAWALISKEEAERLRKQCIAEAETIYHRCIELYKKCCS